MIEKSKKKNSTSWKAKKKDVPEMHARLKNGILNIYVLFASRSQFLLCKLERFHDPAFTDVLNESLLLKVEKQLWVGVQNL